MGLQAVQRGIVEQVVGGDAATGLDDGLGRPGRPCRRARLPTATATLAPHVRASCWVKNEAPGETSGVSTSKGTERIRAGSDPRTNSPS